MERVKVDTKKKYWRRAIACFLTCSLILNMSAPITLALGPGDLDPLSPATGVLGTAWGANTVIDTGHGAIIDWSNFNTISGESVRFNQFDGTVLSSTSAVLNRITSGTSTQFDGGLIGNGRVFVVNPAGIVFGSTATINVTQLVASGLGMSDTAFQSVLASATNKMEFSGGTGDVTNNGTINTTNSAYLVGVNVTNNGSVVCPDGLVVLAAGDSVKLGQPGSSVIVDMAADFTVDTDNDLANSGGIGIQAKNVVLAAGDIWSQALIGTETFRAEAVGDVTIDGEISAYHDGSSDAVATIDIIAGGDVYIENEVTARAESDGVNNANATVTVDAGGSVYVEDGSLEAWALTPGETSLTSGNLTALVDIDADKDVFVGDDGGPDGYVVAVAKTADYATGALGDMTATVDIDAGKVDLLDGNIVAIAKTGLGSNLNAGDIEATVNIDAIGYSQIEGPDVDGDVYVSSSDYYDEEMDITLSPVEAHAEAGSGVAGTAGNVTATVDIYAANYLDVDGGGIQAEALVGYQNYAQAGNLTATVDILSGDGVYVYEGYIEALAHPDNSPATIGDATATVNITAADSVQIEDSDVYAEAYDGANNTATINITATEGNVDVLYYSDETYVEADAYGGSTNIAKVKIDAGNDVLIGQEDYEADDYEYVEVTADAWGDGAVLNQADVIILAGGDVTVSPDGEYYGLYDPLLIEASTWGGGTNRSTVKIDAEGDVKLINDDYEEYYEIEINAYASGGEGTVLNEAKVDIDAANVLVQAINEDVQIYAEAYYGVTNNATIEIDAPGYVNVLADGDWLDAGIYAEAYGGDDNTTKITITAGSVEVTSNAYESTVQIESEAYDGLTNTADVTITTNGDGQEGNEDGNVKIAAYDNGEAWVEAYATDDNEFNKANVTINASGRVEVTAEDGSDAEIYAEAYYGYDNTATIDVTANDGNVDVYASGNSYASIEAQASDAENNNTATVDVTAIGTEDGNVNVTSEEYGGEQDSSAWIYAGTNSAGNINESTVTVNADGDVLAKEDAGFFSWAIATIQAEADEGPTNNAKVMVDAGGDVEVIANHGAAEIRADAYYGNINDASVEVLAVGDVTVKADSDNGISSGAMIFAGAEEGLNNTAEVVIGTVDNSVGDLLVMATNGYNADAEVIAKAKNDFEDAEEGPDGIPGITNKATVDITAASVEVRGEYDAEAEILAEAGNDIDIYSDAGGMEGTIDGSLVNTAGVKIVATGTGGSDGDVLVEGIDGGEAWIGAEAGNDIKVNDEDYDVDITVNGSFLNTAKVDITATDQVRVNANGSDSEAWIYSEASNDIGNESDETATLIVNGNFNNQADTLIDAGDDVEVLAEDGGEASIAAEAYNYFYDLHESQPSETLNVTVNGSADNIANVEITTGDEVWVIADNYSGGDYREAGIFAEARNEIEAYDWQWDDELQREVLYTGTVDLTVTGSVTNKADMVIEAGDNVEVSSGGLSDAVIGAWTGNEDWDADTGGTVTVTVEGSVTNQSDVLVCTEGDVEVRGVSGGSAEIAAYAMAGQSNTANVAVGAGGDEGVIVQAEENGAAFIRSSALDGHTNTAETIVYSEGGVQVVDKSQVLTSAGIIAEALDGYITDAYVGICAEDDVLVMAGITPEDLMEEVFDAIGGHAMIRAEASSGEPEEETSATAEVAVVSRNGGVAVIDATNVEQPGTAEITSSAHGGRTNTAYTGVSAGGDLLSEGHPLYDEIQGTGVVVLGIGDYSHATIMSEAFGGLTNTSDTVVCTPADVVVEAEGEMSLAEIGSSAEEEGAINTATAQVYASEVDVYIPGFYGESGIWAYAGVLEVEPHVPYTVDSGNYDPVDGDYLQFVLTEYDGDYGYQDLVWTEGQGDDTARLLIRNYSERQDCPECPPSPCDDSPIIPPTSPGPGLTLPFIPAAPLPDDPTFELLGYPALMQWVAAELGAGDIKVQIWFAKSVASSTEIQPYEAYTRFRTAAMVLQDSSGAYVAALTQVVNEFAADVTPPSEEQMASMTGAIALDAGANNQYALAGQYLDALAMYTDFLTGEIGYSSEEAVQFVMNKYIIPLGQGENADAAAYVAARLATQIAVP